MTHPETPGSLPPGQRRRLDLPDPLKPDQGMLRELAQAGLSDRGLRTIAGRKSAKAVQAELKRESRRRRAELKKAEFWARTLAAVKLLWHAFWVKITGGNRPT
jgi:hypothetical protein